MKKSITYLWALLCAVLFPRWLSVQSLTATSSILPVAVFVAVAALMRYAHAQPAQKRLTVTSHIAGFLFSSMTAFGMSLEKNETIPLLWKEPAFYFAIICFTHVYACALGALWKYLEKLDPKNDATSRSIDCECSEQTKSSYIYIYIYI